MTHSVYDVNVKRTERLLAPEALLYDLPASTELLESVYQHREAIKRILHREERRFLLIVGPCSIHDEAAGLEYAGRLARLSKQVSDHLLVVIRVYFEKPRTTLGWKGLIYDPHLDGSYDIQAGLHKARQILLKVAELGLPAATEFLDPIVPQYLADLVSWGAIGARTIESQIHRQMASGLSMPIGLKNGTDGSMQNAVDAIIAARSSHGFLGIDRSGRASMVQTSGNPDGHLVLRGGRHGTNYTAEAVAEAQRRLCMADLPPRLVVDCSHANSEKDHTRQGAALREVMAQRRGGNWDIVGAMLESHLLPGNQKLDESDPTKLQYGISITDACIGWEETEQLVTEVVAALATTPHS